MATYIKLKQTPIKEIILTISFKENIEISHLESFGVLPQIREHFPVIGQGFNTQVQTLADKPPTAKVQADGFILRSGNPHSKLLQARRGSLAFHKVNGYENFENLISEFKTYWDLLQANCGKLTVNQLTVRYLNFIDLHGQEKIDELITIRLEHPFGDRVTNRFIQQKFTDLINPSIVITVVSAIGKSDNRDGVVLDIILNKSIQDSETGKFDFIAFDEMRAIKNDLFFRSITEKTIDKYNQ